VTDLSQLTDNELIALWANDTTDAVLFACFSEYARRLREVRDERSSLSALTGTVDQMLACFMPNPDGVGYYIRQPLEPLGAAIRALAVARVAVTPPPAAGPEVKS
jgi:hypothetical protein